MRQSLLFVMVALLFTACSTSKSDRMYLTDWQLSWHNQWYPATVPGFLHTDLMDNGLIEDPYYGTCEDSCRWVEDRVWSYETNIP